MESWWQWSYAIALGLCFVVRFAFRPHLPVSWNDVLILRPAEIRRVACDAALYGGMAFFWFAVYANPTADDADLWVQLFFGVLFPVAFFYCWGLGAIDRASFVRVDSDGITRYVPREGRSIVAWSEVRSVEVGEILTDDGGSLRLDGANGPLLELDGWAELPRLLRLCAERGIPIHQPNLERFTSTALEILNRMTFDPTARGINSDSCLYWPDELPPDDTPEHETVTAWPWGALLCYRESLIEGEERVELRPIWEQVAREAPNWPGLHPERRGEKAKRRLAAARRLDRMTAAKECPHVIAAIAIYLLCFVGPFLTCLAQGFVGGFGPVYVSAAFTLLWLCTYARRSSLLMLMLPLVTTGALLLMAVN